MGLTPSIVVFVTLRFPQWRRVHGAQHCYCLSLACRDLDLRKPWLPKSFVDVTEANSKLMLFQVDIVVLTSHKVCKYKQFVLSFTAIFILVCFRASPDIVIQCKQIAKLPQKDWKHAWKGVGLSCKCVDFGFMIMVNGGHNVMPCDMSQGHKCWHHNLVLSVYGSF